MIVTIDGPAGTGKSSAARALAARLGFEFLDTGAMYRAVAALCLEQDVDPLSLGAAELARTTEIDFRAGRTLASGRDLSSLLRTPETTQAASIVAQNADVRAALVRRQQQLAQGRNIVCEGRDQGTVAFPAAECKFFLTADPVERALRRQKELAESDGIAPTLSDLLAQQHERDVRDATRDVAPLRAAEDAIILDTTGMSLDEVLSVLESHVRRRMPAE